MLAWFYILKLKSGSLYPGATTDLERRWKDHLAGDACQTTNLDPPTALVYSEEYPTFSSARRRESQIKRWSAMKKEALVSKNIETLRNLAKSHDDGGHRK